MLSIFERLLAHLQGCLKCKEIKTFECVLYFAKYQNIETTTLNIHFNLTIIQQYGFGRTKGHIFYRYLV